MTKERVEYYHSDVLSDNKLDEIFNDIDKCKYQKNIKKFYCEQCGEENMDTYIEYCSTVTCSLNCAFTFRKESYEEQFRLGNNDKDGNELK